MASKTNEVTNEVTIEARDVVVTGLGGKEWIFPLQSPATTTVADVKSWIEQQAGPKQQEQQLILGTRILKNIDVLGDLAEPWPVELSLVVVKRKFAALCDRRLGNIGRLGSTGEFFAGRSWTVEAIVWIDQHNEGNPGDNAILGTHSLETNQGLHLSLRGGKPLLSCYWNETVAENALETKRWYHLAYVYDLAAREQRIYVNGEKVACGTGKEPLEGNSSVVVGEWAYGGRYLNGAMMRLLVWREALSEERLMERSADWLGAVGPSETVAVDWIWEETSKRDGVTGSQEEVDSPNRIVDADQLGQV